MLIMHNRHNPAVADAYALGLLLHGVFNPNQGPPATASPPHTPPTASSRGSIPSSVFPSFKRLLHPQPKARLPVKGFLDIGMAHTGEGAGFFLHNPLVTVCASLENFALSSESDKATFLRTLQGSVAAFPPEFAAYKVLPSLVSALEFGGAAAASILPLVLQIGRGVPEDEYAGAILAPLLKLYASADRGTRMALLDALPEYADKLDKKMVVDKIWPPLQTGFLDTVAVIREATVKSIILLAPKVRPVVTPYLCVHRFLVQRPDPQQRPPATPREDAVRPGGVDTHEHMHTDGPSRASARVSYQAEGSRSGVREGAKGPVCACSGRGADGVHGDRRALQRGRPCGQSHPERGGRDGGQGEVGCVNVFLV